MCRKIVVTILVLFALQFYSSANSQGEKMLKISELPPGARLIATGSGWKVYKKDTEMLDLCRACKLYLKDDRSDTYYHLLDTKGNNQKGTLISIKARKKVAYSRGEDGMKSNRTYESGYVEAVDDVFVLSRRYLLISGVPDCRNVYNYIIDLVSYSAVHIEALGKFIQMGQCNGQRYFEFDSYNYSSGSRTECKEWYALDGSWLKTLYDDSIHSDEYRMVFYKWSAGDITPAGTQSLLGHAFVYIPEIGYVGYGGYVDNNQEYRKYATDSCAVCISWRQLRAVREKLRQWQQFTPDYFPGRRDCTSFAMDMADAAGIEYGLRATIQFPSSFINQLKKYNPDCNCTTIETDYVSDVDHCANCYIVSSVGSYKFPTVQGNSNTPVGSVASAKVLWESFGTNIKPNVGDLIKSVSYSDGYIAFKTADNFKEGNAVIAAKDVDGNILWSWHIWLTDQPQGQTYFNNAGTMMDRNLGATSATPGDVGALGLLYQWGRKDPFLGSSSISSSTLAKSTITWPSAVEPNSSNGTIEYAVSHPTTFITYNDSNNDWYYTGDESTDNTRWTTSDKAKSIYDPCPAGWRVPDGGDNGVWSKAKGSSSSFDHAYNSSNEGMNFSGKFGSASTIWYPASGYRGGSGGLYYVGNGGYYWSASPGNYCAFLLSFYYNGSVYPSNSSYRANGNSVRCLQESK